MENTNVLFDRKRLVRLIVPLIVEQVLAVTVGMADMVMVSGAGETAPSGAMISPASRAPQHRICTRDGAHSASCLPTAVCTDQEATVCRGCSMTKHATL